MKTQGFLIALRKTVVFFWAKIIGSAGRVLFKSNSREYWDFRMKYDWNFVGGGEQTFFFAAGAMANVDIPDPSSIETILDYGCATGDSSIILKIFFPNSKIALHDLSKVGVEKAIAKYGRFLPVTTLEDGEKFDLVYCSNVIEHVPSPRDLVSDLINLSSKYILIQCPWNELHPENGGIITPENQTDEHCWTINKEFFEKYIADNRVDWNLTTGVVPMAWEGGVQAFFLGIKK